MSPWQRLLAEVSSDSAVFRDALRSPLEAQQRVLANILSTNCTTRFGQRFGFGLISDADVYRQRVPIHTHADLAPDIRCMGDGERNALCSADIEIYEETSGSTDAAKLVPYTEASLQAFRHALYPWLADLIAGRPKLTLGRSYWAISPAVRAQKFTRDGTAIGMASDAQYFGAAAEHFAALSIVPPQIALVRELEAWRYLTLRFLLDADDLTFISIWSPTFLFPLLEMLLAQRDRFIADVAQGTTSLDISSLGIGQRDFVSKPKRAKEIEAATVGGVVDTFRLWPALDAISCWTDAGARQFVGRLRELFPHAWIQGKGLLATESAVTIPLAEFSYPVLAVRSAFFEFVDARGQPYLCNELVTNDIYRVVLTTHGGLYRYDLGDRVRVRGWAQATPMLEFVGRAGLVSDLCGEKLTEDFVAARLPIQDGFSMLAPSVTPSPHYVLFLDAAHCSEDQADRLARQLDTALTDNPQYSYARRLQQLGPVRWRRIVEPMERYVRNAVECGRRLGDVKPPVLRAETDWEQRLIYTG